MRLRVVVVALLLLLVPPSANHSLASPGQVLSAGESPIVLRLQSTSGWLADVSVKEGGVARLSLDGRPGIGLRVTRTPFDEVALDVIDLGSAVQGDLAVLGTTSLALNAAVDLERWVGRPLAVAWVPKAEGRSAGTCATSAAVAADAVAPLPQRPCTTCCVTCDGVTVCACNVTSACGGCCCPNACDC